MKINTAVLDDKVGFGKYSDLTIGQLMRQQESYFNWAVANVTGFADRLEIPGGDGTEVERERQSHAKFVSGYTLEMLYSIQEKLKKPPPSDEWFVKRWWRLRRDAVDEAIEDKHADIEG